MDQGGEYIRWILSGMGAIAFAAYGFLWKRISGVERDLRKDMKDSAEAAAKSRDKQWTALEGVRKEVGDFKEKILDNMASKADLEKTEKRLIETMERMLKK